MSRMVSVLSGSVITIAHTTFSCAGKNTASASLTLWRADKLHPFETFSFTSDAKVHQIFYCEPKIQKQLKTHGSDVSYTPTQRPSVTLGGPIRAAAAAHVSASFHPRGSVTSHLGGSERPAVAAVSSPSPAASSARSPRANISPERRRSPWTPGQSAS